MNRRPQKCLRLVAAVWLLGSLLTYGHVVKQIKAEIAAECEKQFPNQNAECPSHVRFNAAIQSLFWWPFHWSEEVWK